MKNSQQAMDASLFLHGSSPAWQSSLSWMVVDPLAKMTDMGNVVSLKQMLEDMQRAS